MTTPNPDDQFGSLQARINEFNSLFIKGINQEISNHTAILESLRLHQKSLGELKTPKEKKAERSHHIGRFHHQNLEVLTQHFNSLSSDSFLKPILDEFTTEIEAYLANSPEFVSIPYPRNSFKARKQDPFRVKTLLKFEWGYMSLKKLFMAVGKLFQRASRKQEIEIETRTLKVHYRKLLQGYFFPEYLAQIRQVLKESQILLMESYWPLFEAEFAIIHNDYALPSEGLPDSKENSKLKLPALPPGIFAELENELKVLLQRSGMLLSMNRLRSMGRNHEFKRSLESLQKVNRSWQSTFFAFFEDWRFREQLFAYIQSVNTAHLQVESIYSQRIIGSLVPEIEKQRKYSSELLERLPDPDTSEMEALRSFFVSELYKLKKGKLTKEQQDSILQTSEDIPKLLQKLEHEVKEKLEIFPEKVGVVSNPKYTSGVKPSEIFHFSPAEYIEYEQLREFRRGLELKRNELGTALEKVVSEFSEYDQIIDFYLDSAISLTEKEGMGEGEVITFFREGVKRLSNITQRISDLLNVQQKDKLAEISALLKTFTDHVAELDDNGNILQLYGHLLKSKALAESRNKRKKFIDFTRSLYTRTASFVNNQTKWLQLSYKNLKKRLRLDTHAEPISSHISDYLNDIQQRIYKLPLIYQHLFDNIPIKEFNLFLSREEEISSLNTAHNSWLKGNFAASLVVGENGSGKSSLLYYYSKTLKSKYGIHLFQVSDFYYTEEDYYKLLREIFKQEELTDDQSVLDYISSLKERRIIIIDGLERLFLRKVNGFSCLQKLLSLIVSSDDQILWICSVSKYAYNYLNKTIALSEHFDYSIHMDNLTSRQIRDIVLKRNRLSGYQVSYQMSVSAAENAKTKKLSQSELEDRFFAELNEFASSNISLSLNFWLQSIHSIENDLVEISDFTAPDFGFLENLSMEKAYTLLHILMHGKISAEYHSLIFNQKVEKSRRVLTILKEDSILVDRGEYFILNSILFRHVVRILKNRNLIH